jgi:prepilin-type N-terminal cleavage/methylation domain-containing protein/prepilin-type processing-associated H-X9-DG protein
VEQATRRAETRKGFTLVELLVVVVVIGILVGMLAGGVLSARAAARRTQCLNNLRELGTAMRNYETNRKRFPGYVNRLKDRTVSWAIVLFEDMGRDDLRQAWDQGHNPVVPVSQLVCPDDPSAGQPGRLGYVVNRYICRDRSMTDMSQLRVNQVSLDDIASPPRTILLAERAVNVGPWTETDEARLTFLWPHGNAAANTTLGDVLRSFHGGGANVVFCDGSGQFLPDSTECGVYQPGPVP